MADHVAMLGQLLLAKGMQRVRVWPCACGQKNRVDVARVVATGERPLCGRCRRPLAQRAHDVEEYVIAKAREIWARGTGPDRTAN